MTRYRSVGWMFSICLALSLMPAFVLVAAGRQSAEGKDFRGDLRPFFRRSGNCLRSRECRRFTSQWADAEPMVAFGGESRRSWSSTTSTSRSAASSRSRPVRRPGSPAGRTAAGRQEADRTCCRTATGTWNTSGAKWEESGPACSSPRASARSACSREDAFPHVVSLRFDSSVPLPKDWKLNRPHARKLDSPQTPAPTWRAYVRRGERRGPAAGDRGPDRHVRPPLSARGRVSPAAGTPWKRNWHRWPGRTAGSDADRMRPWSAAATGDWSRCRARPCWPTRCWTSTSCCWSNAATTRPSSACRRTGRATRCLPKTGFDDEIVVLSPVRPDGQLTTLFKPEAGRFVGDVDLHFDADEAAVLDARQQRPLADLRDRRRRHRACGS